MQILKAIPVLAVSVLLIIGVVYGAGIWIFDTQIPLDYDPPITIAMSDEERYYDWKNITLRDTTVLDEANFSHSEPLNRYYTYVKLNNSAGSYPVNISIHIQEPKGFQDQMGFTVLDGIVEPGKAEDVPVENWNSTTHQENVSVGEVNYFTVIYTLAEDAPLADSYEVVWEFTDIS